MTNLVLRLTIVLPVLAGLLIPWQVSLAQRPGGSSPSNRPPSTSLPGPGGPTSSTGLSAQTTDEMVSDIRVEGNRTIPATRITAKMSTRVGRPYDPATLARDVRRLASMPWFVSVRPMSEKTATGRVIILQVVERSVVRYIEYLGNSKLKDRRLAKETGLKEGVAIDPYLVEDGRRKILAAYRDNGYPNAQVSILEGDQAEDQGVIYVINEGVKQKIWSVGFEGNDSDFASDRRLKTRIKSKPGVLFLIGGKLNREVLDADVRKLTEYYRAFGFFQARVGRTIEFNEQGDWATIRFVIHEGPRYQVRSVRFVGNEKFADSSLSSGITLPAGEAFEQAKMNADVEWLKEVYGSQGYVFADVKAEPVFLEEPGKIDLVYHFEEGKRWRVGRIFVHIDGENPHTRIQTALNRLSIRPGEIMDIRELRASERRLQASQLFLSEPARGITPKITYTIPDLDDAQYTAANDPDTFRGQSPEPSKGWLASRLERVSQGIYEACVGTEQESSDGEPVEIHLQVGTCPTKQPTEPVPHDVQYRPVLGSGLLSPTPQRHTAWKPPIDERSFWASQQPSQHAAYAGLTLPADIQVRGQSPAAYPATAAGAQPAFGGTLPGATSPATSPVRPVQYESYEPPAGYTAPAAQPTYPPAAPQYQAAPTTGPAYVPSAAPVTPVGPSPGDLPAPVVGVPSGVSDPALFPGQPFAQPGAYTEPFTDLHVHLQEAQTGRFMVGVGVNSDAGVVGQILIDERNFDWRRPPTSWQDIYNGTAWRGGGQGFRIEAAPGSQVQRYTVSFTEPYLFDTPISMSLSGFYFDRRYDDWDERRTGGRIGYGYQWTDNDLSARLTYRGELVDITQANPITVPNLANGDYEIHGFGFVVTNDTRNNPFFATEGHYLEMQFEGVTGTANYTKMLFDARKYFLLKERPDHSGRHVLVMQSRVGIIGDNSPVFEKYFVGGYSTLRGYDFRGVGSAEGGDFMFVNTLEYLFPITADDMVNGVVFCDMGAIESQVEINNFRVAPGVGLRVQVPAMGPAPIALDFTFPINSAAGDQERMFSFNVGFMR